MALIPMTVRVAQEESDFLDSLATKHEGILSKQAVMRLLLQQAQQSGWDPLDNGFMLGKPSAAKAPEPERGEGFTSSSKAVTKKKNINSLIKSLPPSLHAHEDLITAFWKTKAGAKSEAGWKLLMTELGKIQEKYGDRVVRDQLELAAANRWKGVSLKNYEQFGLNKPLSEPETDWDAIQASMPRTPW